ncbi:mandelate racemase/muconate lactonizing enzyme family protein [Natrarchaeobius chitinivorans]|uniref:Mandelate racemase/muconate lactonizing enzyme family protein n=1 Tax=Natrarchaeobius chitinivorans TaxID=1679083 RepID=A0A3N6PE00_NATCH|nr:mandelate racemase/muconate lactonizing enzyme family protein [Natrarchaeobius chitinivorans]RQG95365.1 mandelate racemase/muconate lactonizing enzyme family protein [Natrarchaeobius chitinivorans]
MKITDINQHRLAYELDGGYDPTWIPEFTQSTLVVELFEVETDEGITGISATATTPGGYETDDGFLEFLEGMDPYELDAIRTKLNSLNFLGPDPWHIEIALWDIIGKDVGKPIYKLLGGRDRQVPVYASTGEVQPTEERLEYVQNCVDEGIQAVKLRFQSEDPDDDLAVARAVREEFPDLTLMVDANMGWSIRMRGDERRWSQTEALYVATELEEIGGVAWLEEPLPQDQYDRLAELRRNTSIAIAGGESNSGLTPFREYLDHDSLDIYQPDAVFATGIRGGKTVAEMARLHGREFAPHTWSNGLGLAANLHLIAASDSRWCEYPLEPPAWDEQARDFMLESPLTHEDGYISPPNGPGLGVELDWDAIEAAKVDDE